LPHDSDLKRQRYIYISIAWRLWSVHFCSANSIFTLAQNVLFRTNN